MATKSRPFSTISTNQGFTHMELICGVARHLGKAAFRQKYWRDKSVIKDGKLNVEEW